MNIDEFKEGVSALVDEFNKTNQSIVTEITVKRNAGGGSWYNTINVNTLMSVKSNKEMI